MSLEAQIVMHHGYPAIKAGGVILPPMAVTTVSHDPRYLRALRDAGIRTYYVTCDTQWLKSDALSQLRLAVDGILRVVPDAFLFLRVGLHPPLSWMVAHPEELVTFNDGSYQPVQMVSKTYRADLPAMYSMASDRWRRDGGRALEAFIDHVEQMPGGERVVGYFLAAGGTSEWYYPGGGVHMATARYADFSPAFRRQFSQLLRLLYGTEPALVRGQMTGHFSTPIRTSSWPTSTMPGTTAPPSPSCTLPPSLRNALPTPNWWGPSMGLTAARTTWKQEL